jgi:hypothetical protein
MARYMVHCIHTTTLHIAAKWHAEVELNCSYSLTLTSMYDFLLLCHYTVLWTIWHYNIIQVCIVLKPVFDETCMYRVSTQQGKLLYTKM